MNSEKILPLRVLARCAYLFLTPAEITDGQPVTQKSDLVSEQIQAKFMALILREFRKNIEYTRFMDLKR
jgi:hypothetical protein